MQTFTTLSSAIDYVAVSYGWTKADAKRAYETLTINTQSPQDELALLNALAKFAGSELKKRQSLQAAQKAQVTIRNKRLEEIELKYAQVVDDYESQLDSERSNFVSLISFLYSIAQKFGYKDAWIDALIATYSSHTNASHKKVS